MTGPSPRITVSLDQLKYHEVVERLDLEDDYVPTVRFVTTGSQQQMYGTYNPAFNAITIYVNTRADAVESTRALQSRLTETLLHELRHAWQQQEHGIDWYAKNVVAAENDANEYAALHNHESKGMIRVGRTFHGNGFSRLSTTEGRVRG